MTNQIDELAYKASQAAFIQIDGSFYRINYFINEISESYIEYMDEDTGEQFTSDFKDLPVNTVFYKLVEVD